MAIPQTDPPPTQERASPDRRSNSSSDEAEEDGEVWVPYARRPEWADVQPMEQDDGEEPIVQIAYSEKFVDVYNYFRAIYASREVTSRALALTRDAAELNPANYTVWHHRRFLLRELLEKGDEGVSMEEELTYVREVIEEHPKNYQVWQHRRAVVEALKNPEKELRFCEIVLSEDPKNYHAWQHRQWAIETFDLYDGELDYIHRLLSEDVRNNSAWNQRFFVVSHEAAGSGGKIGGELMSREMGYTKEAINGDPDNESAWNYFRGLLDNCEESEACSVRRGCLSFCDGLYDKGARASYLLAAIVDLLVDTLEEEAGGECGAGAGERKDAAERARMLCEDLAGEHDVIRREYWSFMARDLARRFS